VSASLGQIRSLNEAADPVKQVLGGSIDLWEGAASARL
jgi:hypothetical protein